MSIAGLLAALIIIGVVGAWVIMPLLGRGDITDAAFINKQRERAQAYYERVLTNIRDLDEDFSTGKMNTDDYTPEREVWVQRGTRLLKLLDELDDQHDIVSDHSADDATIDAAIDAAIEAAVKSAQVELT